VAVLVLLRLNGSLYEVSSTFYLATHIIDENSAWKDFCKILCRRRSVTRGDGPVSNTDDEAIQKCQLEYLCRKPNKIQLTTAVESFPIGYPRVSRFMDSDECFMMYRRFGTIQSRLLLRKQDELRRMEEELLDMDRADDESENNRICLSSAMQEEAVEPENDEETKNQLLNRMEE
jgi:hypothetical protein